MDNEPGRLRHRLALALVAAVLVGVGGVVGILANAGTQTKERTVHRDGRSGCERAGRPARRGGRARVRAVRLRASATATRGRGG